MGGRQRKVSRRIFVGRGAIFREAITQENPLQVVGTINAYSAMLAKATGFRAIYLSGAGVANASFGLPDLGITTLSDVVTDASRINAAVDLPMLVDIDTGFGSAFSITRTIQEMERAGVAAVHIEDQVQAKRCGHRPGKELVSADEMVDRVKASVDARRDESFVIMARTDAHAVEGIESALDRACRYVEAGADMIFAEALADRSEYLRFTQAVKVPVLANLTEFGKTPLYTLDDLRQVGVRLALYPLSAFRAMSLAALRVFDEIRRAGTQQGVVNQMQTREDLYRVLDYHAYEKKLDELFARGNHG
ncbi:methylisocitrate lyase [bacterium]|nr:methylisocitrate lyase [bacterium]